jgi:sensor histidine kinase YesM
MLSDALSIVHSVLRRARRAASAYEHLSIYRKLLLNIVAATVPLLALILYTNVTSAMVIYEQTGDAFMNAVRQASIRMEELRSNAEALSLFISLDRRLNEELVPTASEVDRIESYDSIISTLSDLQKTNRQITSITIFNSRTKELYSSYNSLVAPLNDYFRYAFIIRAYDNQGRGRWIWNNLTDMALVEELYLRDVISFTRPMNVGRKGAYPTGNIVAINFTADRVGSILDDVLSGVFEGAALDFGEKRLLVRGAMSSEVVGRIRVEQEERSHDEGYRQIRDESGRHVLFQAPLENGWRVLATVPLARVLDRSRRIWLFTFAIALLAVLFTITTTHALQAHINVPIHELIQRMRKVQEGDLSTELRSSRQDEFGEVFRMFNTMTQRLREMGRRLYAEGERNREAELMLLQAQINPHFLSNTLDTIYWMAERRNANEISDLALWLGRFYRLNLNQGRDLISTREAMNQLSSYLNVQRVRFDERLCFETRLCPECASVRIPNLLVQPLVENAVYHGVEPSRRACRITVDVRRRNGRLIVRVHDNGVGMSPSKLATIRRDLKSPDNAVQTSYGLKNVHERIRLRYGTEFGITISSSRDRGTLVTMVLPLEKEGPRVHDDHR